MISSLHKDKIVLNKKGFLCAILILDNNVYYKIYYTEKEIVTEPNIVLMDFVW